jgi:hypothetical protein
MFFISKISLYREISKKDLLRIIKKASLSRDAFEILLFGIN